MHYRVDAKAMEDAMAVLSELPYRHVHKVIEAVQKGSAGPFEGEIQETSRPAEERQDPS